MVLQITNSSLPGVNIAQDSANLVPITGGSAADVALVGEADLVTGSAVEEQHYRVTTASQAERLFGDSPLARNIQDALSNGSYPIHAAAASESVVASEDISGIGSTSGSLSSAPLVEDASRITFDVDGTEKTTVLTLNRPSSEPVSADEVYVNAQTGEFDLDAAPSSSGDVAYVALDYGPALDAIESAVGDVVDWIGVLSDSDEARGDLLSTVQAIAGRVTPIIGVAGASPGMEDPTTYTNPADTSRLQLLYSSRDGDGEFLMGSYIGLRGRIGIGRSGIRQRLSGVNSVNHNLTEAEATALDDQQVVVLQSDSRGVKLLNDPTCVASGNTDESQYADALSRLSVDAATVLIDANAERFIGRLNKPAVLNQLRAVLSAALASLEDSSAIVGTDVRVAPVDANTADVDVSLELAKPLRNINVVISSGNATLA
ncbi:tail sheath [Halorubrum tailed virus 27]|uniref:Tail sheath n=1 Tax=Halorubrum tailed virus 27 TaxID=2878008 RepID=A0AAE8XXX9_9CAUD|nr:tail sheath [Halorubrum tailed virus 27]UBF22712.1 tail sheath [Halorubrum tailed virus 27]